MKLSQLCLYDVCKHIIVAVRLSQPSVMWIWVEWVGTWIMSTVVCLCGNDMSFAFQRLYSMEKTNLIDVNLKPHHRPITTHVMHKTVEKKMRVSPHLTAFKVPQGGMSSVVFALIYHFGKMGNLGSKGQVLPQVTGRCGSKSEYSIWKKPHTSTERTFKHHTRFQKPGFEP